MVLFIETKGSPQERGFQQGSQLRDQIHNAITEVFDSDLMKSFQHRFLSISMLKWILNQWGTNAIKKTLKKYFPEQALKLESLSQGAEINEKHIYGIHFIEVVAGIPKLTYKNPPFGCTMLFALTNSTQSKSLLFGRNYDFPNILRPFQMVKQESPDNGYRNISLSHFPLVGSHIGLNEKGLIVASNYGRSWKKTPLDFRTKGIPVTILIQHVLEKCASTQEVINIIQPFIARSHGFHLGIVDRSGDACVLETTSTRSAIRRPNDNLFVHTNLYMTPDLIDANVPNSVYWNLKNMNIPYTKSPRDRYNRALSLMLSKKGSITLDSFKQILSDHNNNERNDFSICTHGLTGSTIASTIIQPKNGEFWVTDHNPCQSNYEKFFLPQT